MGGHVGAQPDGVAASNADLAKACHLSRSTVAAVVAELQARAAGGAPSPVRVQTTALAPKLATSEAAKKAPVMSLLRAG